MPLKEAFSGAMSFRDKLMARHEENKAEHQNDWYSEIDEEDDNEEEMEKKCPTIRMTKKEKERIQRPWRQTLIIKLLWRSIGYHILYKKINELWRPKASVDFVAIDNGFFLAIFLSDEDYEYAKFGGPWMIFQYYLIVRKWQPNFDPNQSSLRNLLVWVRIPCLLIEYLIIIS